MVKTSILDMSHVGFIHYITLQKIESLISGHRADCLMTERGKSIMDGFQVLGHTSLNYNNSDQKHAFSTFLLLVEMMIERNPFSLIHGCYVRRTISEGYFWCS